MIRRISGQRPHNVQALLSAVLTLGALTACDIKIGVADPYAVGDSTPSSFALDQTINTNAGTPATIALAISNAAGLTPTFTVTAAPANGILSGSAPHFTYMPNPGFVGADSIRFKASLGAVSTNATVTVNVQGIVLTALPPIMPWSDDQSNGPQISATYFSADPTATPECRAAHKDDISALAYGPCTQVQGAVAHPIAPSTKAYGNYIYQIRLKNSHGQTTFPTQGTFYVNPLLNHAGHCDTANTDDYYFNLARQYLTAAGNFGAATSMQNPSLKVQFADGTVQTMLSIHKRMAKSSDGHFLLIRREVAQDSTNCALIDFSYQGLPRIPNPYNPNNSPIYTEYDQSCQTVVFAADGNAVCLGDGNLASTLVGSNDIKHHLGFWNHQGSHGVYRKSKNLQYSTQPDTTQSGYATTGDSNYRRSLQE